MKRLLTVFIVFVWALTAFAEVDTKDGITVSSTSNIDGFSNNLNKCDGQTIVSSGGSCSGFLTCQNFEGTGFDNDEQAGWTAGRDCDSATMNEDYAVSPIQGLQSLLIVGDGTTCQIYYQFGTTNPIYYFFKYQPLVTSSNTYFMTFKTIGGANCGSLLFGSNNYVTVYHGSVNSSTPSTLDDNTVYYIWGKYQANTGTDPDYNGIHQVWVSTSGTKPGSPSVNITTGNDNDQAGRIQLYNNAASQSGKYDSVLVSTTEIGNQ